MVQSKVCNMFYPKRESVCHASTMEGTALGVLSNRLVGAQECVLTAPQELCGGGSYNITELLRLKGTTVCHLV